MGFSRKRKQQFDALLEAAREHRLCLVECENRRNGKPAYVLCETWTEDGVVYTAALGKLFDGDPYNEVTPPGVSAPKLI